MKLYAKTSADLAQSLSTSQAAVWAYVRICVQAGKCERRRKGECVPPATAAAEVQRLLHCLSAGALRQNVKASETKSVSAPAERLFRPHGFAGQQVYQPLITAECLSPFLLADRASFKAAGTRAIAWQPHDSVSRMVRIAVAGAKRHLRLRLALRSAERSRVRIRPSLNFALDSAHRCA